MKGYGIIKEIKGGIVMRDVAIVLGMFSIILSVLLGLFILAVKISFFLIGIAWWILCSVIKGLFWLGMTLKYRMSV